MCLTYHTKFFNTQSTDGWDNWNTTEWNANWNVTLLQNKINLSDLFVQLVSENVINSILWIISILKHAIRAYSISIATSHNIVCFPFSSYKSNQRYVNWHRELDKDGCRPVNNILGYCQREQQCTPTIGFNISCCF